MIDLPDVATPRAVSKAAAVVRDREADVAAAKEAVERANKAIQQAAADDRALFADALDAGRDDPGTPHADEARVRLADAERRLAGEELRLTRARDALDGALSGSVGAWEAALTKATEQAEQRSLDLVGELAASVTAQTQLRSALRWAKGRVEGAPKAYVANPPSIASQLPVNVLANPYEMHSVPDLLGHVESALRAASLQAEADRAAEHERQAGQEPQRLHVT